MGVYVWAMCNFALEGNVLVKCGPGAKLEHVQLSLTYAVCECGCADCDCLLTESRPGW